MFQPYSGNYIDYRYHLEDGTELKFFTKYAVKIIDYGRSYYEGNDEYFDKLDSDPVCDDLDKSGFNYLTMCDNYYYICTRSLNVSHDLKALKNILDSQKPCMKEIFGWDDTRRTYKHKLIYHYTYGTPTVYGRVDDEYKEGCINNVTDAHKFLLDKMKQEPHPEPYSIGGTMHVYYDGRPMRFNDSTSSHIPIGYSPVNDPKVYFIWGESYSYRDNSILWKKPNRVNRGDRVFNMKSGISLSNVTEVWKKLYSEDFTSFKIFSEDKILVTDDHVFNPAKTYLVFLVR